MVLSGELRSQMETIVSISGLKAMAASSFRSSSATQSRLSRSGSGQGVPPLSASACRSVVRVGGVKG